MQTRMNSINRSFAVENDAVNTTHWLFIEPGRIGDFVNSSVALKIFLASKNAAIDLVVRSEVAPVVPHFVSSKRIYTIPSNDSWPSYLKLVVKICLSTYDGCCILSPGKSAWFLNKFVRARHKMGYISYPDHKTSFFVSTCLSSDVPACKYDKQKDHLVVRGLKATCSITENLTYSELLLREEHYPRAYISEPIIQKAIDILKGHNIQLQKPLVVFHPGSRWVCKQWPSECWIKLADILGRRGNQILIGAGPGEIDFARSLALKVGSSTFFLSKPIPLDVYVGIIKVSQLLISTDSSSMHLGASVGTPLVGIFGPTSQELSGPIGNPSRTKFVRNAPPCSPCGFPSDDISSSSCLVETHSCFKYLTPGMVLSIIDEIECLEIA